ncbi:VWA domain-containing protein [Terracidiphilus gabretensis]|uniref:VWA domain-containing protein n=1 Tax=Terracidiphilus gabretensis TaxID=1577687 RepID=UPI00071BFBDB|nr:VWA domain-containing protein [Terracidiphilus gabretensis]
MKPGYLLRGMILCATFFAAMHGAAQQKPAPQQPIPPAEPPQPMPGAEQSDQVLRVTTKEVLVPTLVEKHDGGVVYGLKAQDFVVEDNGVSQKVHVQEEMDTAPVALVVAVEQGGMSVLEFDKFMKLAPLLDTFMTDDKSQAALIGFDSEPHLIKDFSHSGEELNEGIKHMEPGDGGDAIMDTISYAVDLLGTQPREFRRVLLLISEARDHGSKHTKTEALIRKIGQSDVLVLTVSFSPARAEFLHDVKDSGEERTMNMVSALVMLAQAVRKNVTKEIANMSGGEYTTFTGDKKFEQRVLDAAKHTRNRYLLTFSPSNPTPGLHTLKVRLASDYGARIVARANYWVGEEAPAGGAQ